MLKPALAILKFQYFQVLALSFYCKKNVLQFKTKRFVPFLVIDKCPYIVVFPPHNQLFVNGSVGQGHGFHSSGAEVYHNKDAHKKHALFVIYELLMQGAKGSEIIPRGTGSREWGPSLFSLSQWVRFEILIERLYGLGCYEREACPRRGVVGISIILQPFFVRISYSGKLFVILIGDRYVGSTGEGSRIIMTMRESRV